MTIIVTAMYGEKRFQIKEALSESALEYRVSNTRSNVKLCIPVLIESNFLYK